MTIFKRILIEKQLRPTITAMLLQYLDASLDNSPLASEEYFNLLTLLLTETNSQVSTEEAPKELKLGNSNVFFNTLAAEQKRDEVPRKRKQSSILVNEVSESTKGYFRKVLGKIDGELAKLFTLEQEKRALGQDGFMPHLSAGQSLCRLVRIVALMMKDQPILTQIVQENVKVILKTLLKLKKLTLVKNKQI